MKRVPVPVPAFDEQRAIAAVLGALDDKIELNRQMNATLEAMARALFKSWFVDFDPVRAKMAGHTPYGMDAATAALFPAAFTDSPLGPIPDGWTTQRLRDFCNVEIGGDWGEDIPFSGAVETVCLRGVDLEHLRQTGFGSAPRRWIKRASVERRTMNECDILIAGSGAGPCGRPLWICNDIRRLYDVPLIYSNFCKRLRTASPHAAVYLDRILHNLRESGQIWEYVNGTSVPNLNLAGLLESYEIVVPPPTILRSFFDFFSPVANRLYSGETQTLATIRDTLLPKLLSGAVRVRDAARVVEAAQ